MSLEGTPVGAQGIVTPHRTEAVAQVSIDSLAPGHLGTGPLWGDCGVSEPCDMQTPRVENNHRSTESCVSQAAAGRRSQRKPAAV